MNKVKKSKKNIYHHAVDLSPLAIKNKPREEFRKILEEIEYRGHQVEELSDGRKIIITKPGGKFVYGTVKREDFMVWIYDSKDNGLWLISHKNIFEDLEGKAKINKEQTLKIIESLERVYNGEEPDDVLANNILTNPCGELPELLLKAYKWIWGQEDCNYPTGEGRNMSMKIIRKLKEKL
jgi:hypothetical protein